MLVCLPANDVLDERHVACHGPHHRQHIPESTAQQNKDGRQAARDKARHAEEDITYPLNLFDPLTCLKTTTPAIVAWYVSTVA